MITINDSTLAKHVVKTSGINIGQLYFFNNIVISEFKEGVHITYENAQELIRALRHYFGASRPFGFISNMVNSYSMNPTDSLRFKQELKNLTAYGVVAYTNAGRLNAEIENKFCKDENICFNDIYEAADTIYNKVKQVKIPVD